MDIFEQSSSLDFSLSMDAKRMVGEFLHLVDDAFRNSKQVVKGFLNIINSDNCAETLDQMFETRFLDAFIPEFKKIRDRVQFDAYHIFPVGRHIIETVRNLKDLANQKEVLLQATFSDLPEPELLLLAGLFHDIGKVGKRHARKGVFITRKILIRFNYTKKWTDEILFLIEYHLLLVETATRRDLNDEKGIVQCARIIRDIDRLKMLYLLTWADSKATGPGAWSDWTAKLVQELFFKILHVFEKKELAAPGSTQIVKKKKVMIVREMKDRMGPEELENLFEIMSPRYMLNTPPSDIVRHLDMLKQLKKDSEKSELSTFVIDAKEGKTGDFWEINFLSKDRPGLFSDIAGVMGLNNINILSSNIYTWRDGTAVDIFAVTNPLDTIHPDGVWKSVERDLKNIFSGKLSLPYRLSKKAAPSVLSIHDRKPARPPEVVIDNNSSDFFSLIEVFAADRVGLLYLITRTLSDLLLDIRIAKTGVKGDQIADVFYVRDLEGQKLYDDERVKEIREALLFQLRQDDVR